MEQLKSLSNLGTTSIMFQIKPINISDMMVLTEKTNQFNTRFVTFTLQTKNNHEFNRKVMCVY